MCVLGGGGAEGERMREFLLLNVRYEMTDRFVSTDKIKKWDSGGSGPKKGKDQQEEEELKMGRKNESLDVNR